DPPGDWVRARPRSIHHERLETWRRCSDDARPWGSTSPTWTRHHTDGLHGRASHLIGPARRELWQPVAPRRGIQESRGAGDGPCPTYAEAWRDCSAERARRWASDCGWPEPARLSGK